MASCFMPRPSSGLNSPSGHMRQGHEPAWGLPEALAFWLVTFPTQEHLQLEQEGGSGSPPQTAGVRDSGLWGRAHTPCMTGTGQGKCSLPWAGRRRKAHPGVL